MHWDSATPCTRPEAGSPQEPPKHSQALASDSGLVKPGAGGLAEPVGLLTYAAVGETCAAEHHGACGHWLQQRGQPTG